MKWKTVNPFDLDHDGRELHAAVHEAGHAFVGVRVGLIVEWVSINPLHFPEVEGLAPGDFLGGATAFVRDERGHEGLIADKPDRAAMLSAGYQAEQLLLGRHLKAGYEEDALIMARGLRDLPAAERLVVALRAKENSLAALEANLPVVRALAQALLEAPDRRLMGERVAALCTEAE